jgi:hypothetical protein
MRKLLDLASTLDGSALSPAWWGEQAHSCFYERRRHRAATDQEWADIEARRHVDGGEFTTFLSEDLTWEDFERQRDIAMRITPVSLLEKGALLLREVSYLSAVRAAVHAGQRVVRGWDDRTLWSLDHSLAVTLGAQLTRLADIAHGWPGNEEFPAFEDWTAALRENGAKLSAYGADDENGDLYGGAQDALRWVADHLGYIWD